MNKLAQRLLTFFIGIPLVVMIIFFSFFHHLLLNITVVIFSVLAAVELHKLFSENIKMPPIWLSSILSALMPIVSYCAIFFIPSNADNFTHWTFILSALIMMCYEVFAHKTFEDSNKRLPASVFLIFYCGFLLTFITRMSLLKIQQ